jgi:hypothetical protein
MQWFVLMALCALTVGCGDQSATSSSPVGPSSATTISGTWSGLVANANGQNTLRLSLSQDARAELSGTWMWTDGNGNMGGTLGGVARGNAIDVTLRPGDANVRCTVNVTATVSGSRMTGTYAGAMCPEQGGGSIDLSKQ